MAGLALPINVGSSDAGAAAGELEDAIDIERELRCMAASALESQVFFPGMRTHALREIRQPQLFAA
jgi:hypothetical protein